ncbi:hypothetical protein D3C85_1820920 [compost metagenome]
MKPFLKSTKLIVHRNPQTLKAPFGGMPSRSARSCRNAFLNQLCQFSRALHRVFFSPLYNLAGNPP